MCMCVHVFGWVGGWAGVCVCSVCVCVQGHIVWERDVSDLFCSNCNLFWENNTLLNNNNTVLDKDSKWAHMFKTTSDVG